MQIVIEIPEEEYKIIKNCTAPMTWVEHLIKDGTPLPKGHGDLITKEQAIELVEFYQVNPQHFDFVNLIDEIKYEKPIIEADNKYEAKVITRGNCMMCGQELTEGLFFCKECEDKGKE